jgi:hypothetical protein
MPEWQSKRPPLPALPTQNMNPSCLTLRELGGKTAAYELLFFFSVPGSVATDAAQQTKELSGAGQPFHN